jgi:hypothetical protein
MERFIRCRACARCSVSLFGTMCAGGRATKEMRGEFTGEREGFINCFDFADRRDSDGFDEAMMQFNEKYGNDGDD